MALSFIQWEKYIQGFPDDRLGKEFQDPGSTVSGSEKPPQAIVISEMGTRNAAREADASMQANQNQPNGSIAEQTFSKFSEASRPPGGPGGGPPPGPGGPPMGQGGPPQGGPPMGPGGPPPGGPPMGGPPMRAYGGSIPGYQYGGSIPGYEHGGDTEKNLFMRGLGGITKFATGADSFQDAAENPFRTLGRTALTGAMFIPGLGAVGMGGRAAMGLGRAAMGGARATRGIGGLGKYVTGLEAKGGASGMLGRALGARSPSGLVLNPRHRKYTTKAPFGPKPNPQLDLFNLKPDNVRRLLGKNSATGKLRSQLNPAQDAARRARAATRLANMPQQVGRRALLRGGGGLGVAGLLALDPFDAGDPEEHVQEPNTDLADSPAIRADRDKGYAGGAFDFLSEETDDEQNLRQIVDYRNKGIASGDFPANFRDRTSRELVGRMDQRRALAQGYADMGDDSYMMPGRSQYTMPARASGGIIGLQNGGSNDDAQGYTAEEIMAVAMDSDPTAGGHSWDPTNPGRNVPEGYEVHYVDDDSGPTLRSDREEGKTIWNSLGRSMKSGYDRVAPYLPEHFPGETGGRRIMVRDTMADSLIPGFDPEIHGGGNLEEQRANLRNRGKIAELVPIAAQEAPSDPRSPGGPAGPPAGGAGGGGGPVFENSTQAHAGAEQSLLNTIAAQQEEQRAKNPEEQARDEYWATRADDARGDAKTRLMEDVASSILGSRGSVANIGEGLIRASQGQRDQRELIRDLEGLPITADVERSRRNRYDTTAGAYDSIAARLAARAGADATIAGRLEEMQMQLDQGEKMDMTKFLEMEQMLRLSVERGTDHGGMSQEAKDAIMATLEAQMLDAQQGISVS